MHHKLSHIPGEGDLDQDTCGDNPMSTMILPSECGTLSQP